MLVLFHHKSAVNVLIIYYFITIYKKYCNYYYLPSDGPPEAISFMI